MLFPLSYVPKGTSYRPLLILTVEFELALAVWLLSGLFKKAALLTGLMCFSAFSVITLFKALTGAASCGCFGSVHVNPWITLFAIEKHGDGIVMNMDTVNIKEGLDQGTLSMVIYDQALLGALNAIVDTKILDSFLRKNKLAPPMDLIQFKETWDQKGLMLNVLVNGDAYSEEAFPKMSKDEYQLAKSNILTEIANSVQSEIRMKNFSDRIDEFVSAEDKSEYFSDPAKFNNFNLLAFLKSKAKIDENMSSEMRDLFRIGYREISRKLKQKTKNKFPNRWRQLWYPKVRSVI